MFKDEKILWYSEAEMLAKILANKSQHEIQDLFDKHRVIELRSIDRPRTTIKGRLLMPFVYVMFLIIGILKWIITGDRFLNSLFKKHPIFSKIAEYCGIE